jgi:hypothetical protein
MRDGEMGGDVWPVATIWPLRPGNGFLRRRQLLDHPSARSHAWKLPGRREIERRRLDLSWQRLLSLEVGISQACRAYADAARELLDGKREIAEFCVPQVGKVSLHADVQVARSTLARVRALEREHGVRVVLAHDVSWIKEGTDSVLLSLLDDYILSAREQILRDEIP